jgi:hypothetical protein
MSVRIRGIVVALVAVLSLAACGTDTSGEPVSKGPRPGAPEAGLIPPVQNPRDVAPMVRRACELLTPRQAAEFGLDMPPALTDGLFGTTRCEWTHADRERTIVRNVYVSMFTNNPTVETVYRKRAGFVFFKLDLVDGYPASVTRSNSDLPICSVDVKTAERQSVTVTYDSEDLRSDPQRSCDVAKRVASAVLTNLPPKS